MMLAAMVCLGLMMVVALIVEVAKEPIQQGLDRLSRAHDWLRSEWYARYTED